jgi:hypothetical protein
MRGKHYIRTNILYIKNTYIISTLLSSLQLVLGSWINILAPACRNILGPLAPTTLHHLFVLGELVSPHPPQVCLKDHDFCQGLHVRRLEASLNGSRG